MYAVKNLAETSNELFVADLQLLRGSNPELQECVQFGLVKTHNERTGAHKSVTVECILLVYQVTYF